MITPADGWSFLDEWRENTVGSTLSPCLLNLCNIQRLLAGKQNKYKLSIINRLITFKTSMFHDI